MGYFIRFIHNRDLAVENIVSSVTRFSFMILEASRCLGSVHDKLEAVGAVLPDRSMLREATRVRKLQHLMTSVNSLFLMSTVVNNLFIVIVRLSTPREVCQGITVFNSS